MNYLILACVAIFPLATFATQINIDLDSTLKPVVESDLQFIENIVSAHSSPLHHAVFGNVDGLSYKKWLEDRVSTITIDKNDSCENHESSKECISEEGTYESKTLVLSTAFYENDYPQVARASLLFHQARHLENTESFSHVNCGMPFAPGQKCDRDLNGAYAIQSILLMNLSQNCSDQSCNAKVKEDAKIYADQFRMRVMKVDDRKAMSDDTQTQ